MATAVVRRVLDTDQRGLGTRDVTPEPAAPEVVLRQHHVTEEVVRGEEREVSTEIAVALHDVVDLLRHVLLVTREDDEVVQLRQVVTRRETLEILVREVVGLPAGVHEKAQEPALVRAVVRWLP